MSKKKNGNVERENFALKHQKICRKKAQPSDKLRCGRGLYDFLKEKGIELDVAYNHKKGNPLTTPQRSNV